MGESQSRYGIIEELTNRKINQKEKLANIERETDKKVYEMEKEIAQKEQEIKDKENCYEFDHKDFIRTLEVNLDMLTKDFERKETTLKNQILDENNTYKKMFEDWKKHQLNSLKEMRESLADYKKVQKSKIQEKKEIIAETEKGIADLKEVSKESQGKE